MTDRPYWVGAGNILMKDGGGTDCSFVVSANEVVERLNDAVYEKSQLVKLQKDLKQCEENYYALEKNRGEFKEGFCRLQAENARFIKANAEVAAINADLNELVAKLQGNCEHRYMYFGEQKKRRCADCNQVER